MSKAITLDEMAKLACKYGLQLADLQTIREVETAGSGFLSNGHPKILFERHWFSRFTGGKYDVIHPDISGDYDDPKHWTYYRLGMAEWARFDKAAKLGKDGGTRDAAIRATSWGAGQVMGDHYKSLGFATPQEFLNENFKGEAEQLEIMLKFIRRNPALFGALKGKRWEDFAKLYNGKDYAKNKYHIKLAVAHKKFSGQAA